MIIPSNELITFKEDFDLSKIKDISFYVKKVRAISDSNFSHQRKMKKDALVILKYLKTEYPEMFI